MLPVNRAMNGLWLATALLMMPWSAEAAADAHAVTPGAVHAAQTTAVNTSPQNAGAGTKTVDGEAQPIDLDQLVQRLKQTKAIGFLTKLAIRSDVLDFRDRVDTYRKKHQLQQHLATLRDRFNGLLLKILALLEDDPKLAHAIYAARETIWQSLVEVKG